MNPSRDEVVESVEFPVDGDVVRGSLRLPRHRQSPSAGVVLAHGWSMVAEGDLQDYAREITSRGIATLTFDFRGLGRSDGEPRQEIDPWKQVEDFRSAVSYIVSRPEIDRDRIGVWGSSYSGGHALVLGAIDRRVKCVVSQVPTVSGYAASIRRSSTEQFDAMTARLEADRENRFASGAPGTIQTIAQDPDAPTAYPQPESFAYMSSQGERCATWQNFVTLRSLELARQYEPGQFIERIGSKPLLMIVADNDAVTPTDLQLGAYNRALPPKELLLVTGDHYSVYTTHFDRVAGAAADWFGSHLSLPAA